MQIVKFVRMPPDEQIELGENDEVLGVEIVVDYTDIPEPNDRVLLVIGVN